MSFLSEDAIRSICPNAENIVVTGDSSHLDIGVKVGLFAQATVINFRMDEETQRRVIRNLYMDLVMMNRRQDEQVLEAQEAARGAQR